MRTPRPALLAGALCAVLLAGACGGTDEPAGDASGSARSDTTGSAGSPDGNSDGSSTPATPDAPAGQLLAVLSVVAGPSCPARVADGTACDTVRIDGGSQRQALTYRQADVQALDVASAEVTTSAGGSGPVVDVVLAGRSRLALTRLTRTAANDHRSLLLLTRRHVPLVAPTVATPITVGRLQISGLGTRARAESFVSLITSASG